MAKKRRRKRGGSRSKSSGLSDGVKQSIIAIGLAALAVFFLLAFFDLAGSAGVWADGLLSQVFGWDRWLFSLVLLVIGWHVVFPDKTVFGVVNYIGLVLFFMSFNGLLNLFILDDVFSIAELSNAGGYIGMLVSELLVGWLGFWGSFVIVFASLCIAIILIFDISLQNILTVPGHFAQLGVFMKKSEEDDSVLYADEDEEFDEDEQEESPEEEEVEDEGGGHSH